MCHHVLTYIPVVLSTSNLTHHSRLLFNCECVFICVSGRAAISCCTFALPCGQGGVSQQCVGRHRDITHIPTCRAAPVSCTVNSWIYAVNWGVTGHFLALSQ